MSSARLPLSRRLRSARAPRFKSLEPRQLLTVSIHEFALSAGIDATTLLFGSDGNLLYTRYEFSLTVIGDTAPA